MTDGDDAIMTMLVGIDFIVFRGLLEKNWLYEVWLFAENWARKLDKS